MVSYVYLTSAVIMGLLAVAVFVATARGRNWYDYRPQISPPERGVLEWLASDVRAWILGFVVLVLATMGTVLMAMQGNDPTPVYAVLALLVAGVVSLGVYAWGRSRGHPHAHAIGEAAIALGAVVLLAIAGRLLTQFGA